jgi:MFS family permease
MSQFYRVSSAIIAPDLSRDLGLNSQELGLLGAIFFYVFALFQPPLGLLLDRIGARISMVLLNCIAILGAIIFAHAGSLPGGVIGRGLLGLGMSANLMGTFKLFTNWFELGKFATITGLLLSMGALGTLAATSPLALLVQALGWRGAFYALAPFDRMSLDHSTRYTPG